MTPTATLTMVISGYQAAAIGATWAHCNNFDETAAEETAQAWYEQTSQMERYRSTLEQHLSETFHEQAHVR